MGEFIGGVLIMLIGVVIGSTIPAIFLRLSAKWIAKTEMLYGHAYKTVLTASVVNVFIMIGFSLMAGFLGPLSLLYIPIGFCVMAAVVGSRLAIPFGQSCLVTLVMGAMSGVVFTILFGLFMFLVATLAIGSAM